MFLFPVPCPFGRCMNKHYWAIESAFGGHSVVSVFLLCILLLVFLSSCSVQRVPFVCLPGHAFAYPRLFYIFLSSSTCHFLFTAIFLSPHLLLSLLLSLACCHSFNSEYLLYRCHTTFVLTVYYHYCLFPCILPTNTTTSTTCTLSNVPCIHDLHD